MAASDRITAAGDNEEQMHLFDELVREHKELRQYITLEGEKHNHNGKLLYQVGNRQQQRNLTQIKSSAAEAALWFLKSYWIQLGSISMKDNDSKTCNYNF